MTRSQVVAACVLLLALDPAAARAADDSTAAPARRAPADQVATFSNVMHGNNRPVQRRNGRKVVTDLLAETSAN